MLGDPEGSEKRRSRESLTVDTVKYESGPDGGEEVSMGVEWSGVSTARGPAPCSPSSVDSASLRSSRSSASVSPVSC